MKDSNIWGYVFIAIALFFVFRKVREGYRMASNPDAYKMHCMTCGAEEIPKRNNKGSGLIEIILWLCFVIPGLIYSIWRRSNRPQTCPVCRSTTVVPKNTLAAIKHREQLTGSQ